MGRHSKAHLKYRETMAVKPLRMIDEVCFEMANIKQMRLKMEYVTISKSEYDFLVTYRPG